MSDPSHEVESAVPEPTPPAQAEPAPLESQPVQRSVALSESKGSRLRVLGIALVVLGIALALAPRVSAQVAQALAWLRAPEFCGGLLVSAGLGLVLCAALQRALGAIRSSLAELQSESARLETLSRDTQKLGESVGRVQAANQSLQAGVTGLETQLGKLTEIASNPDNSVSMFRLAASVDQLGAKLDRFLKDQFKTMREELAGVVESSQQSEQSLGRQLAELGVLVREQYALHTKALDEGLGSMQAEAERALEGIGSLLRVAAGIETQVAAHKQALKSAFDLLGDDRVESTQALQADLAALRTRIESAIQEQQARIGEQLARVDETLELSGSERDAHARGLAEDLRQLIEAHSVQLRRCFSPITEANERIEQVEIQVLESLATLDAHASGQSQALQTAFEAGLERVESASTHAGVATEESLKAVARLEASLADCRDALTRTLEAAWEAFGTRVNELGGAQERVLGEQLLGVAGRLGQIDLALEAAREDWSAQAAGLGKAHERALDERLLGVAAKLEQLDLALVAARKDWSAQVVQISGAHERALEQQLHGVAGKLEQIDSAIDNESRIGLERATQALEDAQRLEQELAGHSARLEQLAQSLSSFADLVAKDRAERFELSAAGQRELAFEPGQAIERLIAPLPPIVPPEIEPAPALPSSLETRPDVIP